MPLKTNNEEDWVTSDTLYRQCAGSNLRERFFRRRFRIILEGLNEFEKGLGIISSKIPPARQVAQFSRLPEGGTQPVVETANQRRPNERASTPPKRGDTARVKSGNFLVGVVVGQLKVGLFAPWVGRDENPNATTESKNRARYF